MENTQLLKEMRLFHGISTLDMVQVNKRVKSRRYTKGEMVIEEGVSGPAAIYIIKTGSFEVFVDKRGNKEILATLDRSETFGELSLIDGGSRSANVACAGAGELLSLTQDDFRAVLAHSAALREKITRTCCKTCAPRSGARMTG